jgi:hypothetical protein
MHGMDKKITIYMRCSRRQRLILGRAPSIMPGIFFLDYFYQPEISFSAALTTCDTSIDVA